MSFFRLLVGLGFNFCVSVWYRPNRKRHGVAIDFDCKVRGVGVQGGTIRTATVLTEIVECSSSVGGVPIYSSNGRYMYKEDSTHSVVSRIRHHLLLYCTVLVQVP